MANFSLTKLAVQDLKEIWNYTYDKWSENQADKYINELLGHCTQISSHTLKGRSYKILHPKLRGLKVGKHIIFYQEVGIEEIEVIRILHQRMDLNNKFVNF